jgi:hypothetical protein
LSYLHATFHQKTPQRSPEIAKDTQFTMHDKSESAKIRWLGEGQLPANTARIGSSRSRSGLPLQLLYIYFFGASFQVQP